MHATGGFGLVCKALWRTNTVAVKVIISSSPDVQSNVGTLEGLLCKELRHPNIIQVGSPCTQSMNMQTL